MIAHGVTEDAGHERFVKIDFRGQVGKGNRVATRDGLSDSVAHDGLQANVVIVLLPSISLFEFLGSELKAPDRASEGRPSGKDDRIHSRLAILNSRLGLTPTLPGLVLLLSMSCVTSASPRLPAGPGRLEVH